MRLSRCSRQGGSRAARAIHLSCTARTCRSAERAGDSSSTWEVARLADGGGRQLEPSAAGEDPGAPPRTPALSQRGSRTGGLSSIRRASLHTPAGGCPDSLRSTTGNWTTTCWRAHPEGRLTDERHSTMQHQPALVGRRPRARAHAAGLSHQRRPRSRAGTAGRR